MHCILLHFAIAKNIEWQQYQSYNTGIDSYWYGRYNLFGASLENNKGRFGEATFCWNETYFSVRCRINDPQIYFGDYEVYNMRQTQIALYFGGDSEYNFFIQPKQNGHHKIYLNNYAGLNKIEEIDNYSVMVKKTEEGCIIYSMISWEQLRYSPKVEGKMKFGINILLYQDRLEYPLYLSFYKLHKNGVLFVQ